MIATPNAGCSVTTTDLAFLTTGIVATALREQASLGITCTGKASFSVALDNATGTAQTLVATAAYPSRRPAPGT